MDAQQAIADLTEISPQIRRVVVVAGDGSVVGSNLDDSARAQTLADGGRRLGEAADALRAERGLSPVAQLEAATVDGSVFVVRDGERSIVATTTPEPTVGLVFYDLKTCLRSVDEAPKPPRRGSAKSETETEGEDAAA